MKSMIPVWAVVIDKSKPSYPLYVKNALVDHRIVWGYYQDNNDSLKESMKAILGIPEDAPVVFNTFCDYLIDPESGEIHVDMSGESLGDFMIKSFERHVDLVESAGKVIIYAAKA